MVICDSRGYSGPMGVMLQSHNTLSDQKVTNICMVSSVFMSIFSNSIMLSFSYILSYQKV